MEWTGLNDIREKYLSFFETKEHLRLPSFSLIPEGDKSLLLINAGMAPMKKYFTGELTPPRKRVTTCQKCIRTPDIENVGKTARHGTFFEMLGNFSFGDYFKKEATRWAWEFTTEVMKMPADRLYISVYKDDDEAYDIWTKEIGVSPDRMVRLGKEDNFWEHGAGPCGPCSEIYFDRGEKYGCGKPDCAPGCDCDRFIEFWNIVFTQFENDGNGNYTRLDHPNIDTGMGLERLACIMQDVDNLFEVDTIQNILRQVSLISGVKYKEDAKKDVSLRVITDHIRSSVFMISDGVLPSNEGRGYVLRRLLRRAARHGRLLGTNEPFLAELAATVIKESGSAYPELVEKQDYIVKVLKNEEENFARTIDRGLGLLEEMTANLKGSVLDGDSAFKLSDTFGFPIDLTKEILAEKNITVDEDRYNELIGIQKATARGARKDAGADAWKNTGTVTAGLAATGFDGYDSMECEASVAALIKGDERVNSASAGDEVIIVLDRTVFYAESGGQVGDTGKIVFPDGAAEVTNTTKTPDGVILHKAKIESGDLTVNENVTAVIDKDRRVAIARNHTCAHLLQAALRSVLGSHVHQAGSYVDDKEVRFDFTHFSAMTPDEIKQTEALVNEYILDALTVTMTEMDIEDAKKTGATALFGEKYGDRVRVVKAGDISTEFCGGTHINNTSRLGLFRIVSETSVASGVRRIAGVTGKGVLDQIAEMSKLIGDTAAVLKAGNVKELAQKAEKNVSELRAAQKEIETLKSQLSEIRAGEIAGEAVVIKGVNVTASDAGEIGAADLRALSDKARDKDPLSVSVFAGTANGKVVFVCSCGPEAVKLGADAGAIVRETAKIAGGSGGGRKDSATAGAKDPTKVANALAAVPSIVEGLIKD